MGIIRKILNSVALWDAWLVIPLLMEFIPAMGNILVLARRQLRYWLRIRKKPAVYPEISVIIPVYNSSQTLEDCLGAIYRSTYPTGQIRVFLVNNEGQDDSFQVYTRCQEQFPALNMQWLNASQGKSRALNLALYNSEGKYIINMDSDGMVEAHALQNLIEKFESEPDLNCITGAILTMPDRIQATPGFFLRLLRKLEFMEYVQSFLAGRSYASETNTIYTLSGAFSAFRKSAILKSRLYSTDTICEDTQLTAQMRYLFHERVEVCESAIFFTEPIEDMNKLYTQRQRWQRGSLEVAQLFSEDNLHPAEAFRDVNVRTLLYDHTFAFPRLIWYIALICLACMHYSTRGILASGAIIYGIYVLLGIFYFISAVIFLGVAPKLRSYYLRNWWVVPLLPLFNLMVFFIRMAGAVNSTETDSTWKTKNLTQEKESVLAVLRRELAGPAQAVKSLREKLTRPEGKEKDRGNVPSVGFYVLSGVLLFLSATLFIVTFWIKSTYGVGLNEIVNTLTGNLTGTGRETVLAVVRGCVLPPLAVLGLYVVFAVMDRRERKKGRRGSGNLLPRVGAVLLAVSVLYTNLEFDVLSYYIDRNTDAGSGSGADIYREYYVPPDDVTITAGEKKKNLIYIYLESMETIYASTAEGGRQSENYIPNLTRLARENISFSNREGLGGFHTVNGAGYTMAAIFATTSGIPYALPVDSTAINETGTFASGLTSLGDILDREGYTQEFLCGSDAAFGGRKLYFQQHGNYDIFDLYTAREKGYIPEDYYVWWGYEDEILFQIARDEVTRLAGEAEPFNLTMLTVDLHHIAGYVCGRCGNSYGSTTANVAACTDQLVSEFIDWCKTQPFYEDTVIVITGDHPRMDTCLVDGVDYYDRTVYNCFLNTGLTPQNTENREFTHMDIFPSVLSALGYTIEGDRLGLGTNLFSGREGLTEQFSFEYINRELSKNSSYYVDTFAPELSGHR